MSFIGNRFYRLPLIVSCLKLSLNLFEFFQRNAASPQNYSIWPLCSSSCSSLLPCLYLLQNQPCLLTCLSAILDKPITRPLTQPIRSSYSLLHYPHTLSSSVTPHQHPLPILHPLTRYQISSHGIFTSSSTLCYIPFWKILHLYKFLFVLPSHNHPNVLYTCIQRPVYSPSVT